VVLWVQQLHFGHELAARGAALADPAEDRLDGLLLLRAHALERRELREVDVRSRQMPQEIANGADLDPVKQLRRVVSDPGKRCHRKLERASRSANRRGGPSHGNQW